MFDQEIKEPAMTPDEINACIKRDADKIALAAQIYEGRSTYKSARHIASLACKRQIVVIKKHKGTQYRIGPFITNDDITAKDNDGELVIRNVIQLQRRLLNSVMQIKRAGYFTRLVDEVTPIRGKDNDQ